MTKIISVRTTDWNLAITNLVPLILETYGDYKSAASYIANEVAPDFGAGDLRDLVAQISLPFAAEIERSLKQDKKIVRRLMHQFPYFCACANHHLSKNTKDPYHSPPETRRHVNTAERKKLLDAPPAYPYAIFDAMIQANPKDTRHLILSDHMRYIFHEFGEVASFQILNEANPSVITLIDQWETLPQRERRTAIRRYVDTLSDYVPKMRALLRKTFIRALSSSSGGSW